MRRVLGDRAAAVSLGVILVLVGVALAAPLITGLVGHSPNDYDSSAVDAELGGLPRAGMTADHWFGVEPGSGRDVFARIVWGARVSLLISGCATLTSVAIGTIVGLVAGFFGGWIDAVIGRLMDVLMSFPALIFMIAAMSVAPDVNRELILVVVLGLFGWPYVGRLVRGQTMSLAKREFVEAARALGASRRTLLFTEVLPNLAGPILVVATLSIPAYITTEAGLSFLGVGIRPPTPSWGQMIASAVPWYATDPLFFLIPGLFLFVTVLAFNALGDAIRDALDPRSKAR